MKKFNELKKNLKKDFPGLKVIKIALLGDSATQLLAQAIKGYGYEQKIKIDIFDADYDQIDLQIFDPTSKLYKFNPEFVIIFHSTQKLIRKFHSKDLQEKLKFADNHIEYVSSISQTLTFNLSCSIIYFNFLEVNDYIFGNYSNKVEASLLSQLRKINYGLMNLCRKSKNLFINDLSSLQNLCGNNFVWDCKTYVNSDIAFSIDFIPLVAKNTVDIILAILGKIKKCLILDLDGTLWGGIIGDDGIEGIQIGDLGIGKAFSEIQLWAKNLKERGILLVVCSKNDDTIAKEPFIKHPDMILRLHDFVLFVANWNNKVDNIKYIQSILNIGFDSMVFFDDNPFERNMVKTNIPEITVLDLPEDPVEYLNFIRSSNLFETAFFTEEDGIRTQQYQQEAQRAVVQRAFTNQDDFLANLSMVSNVRPFNKFNIPRVAQLTQRSNQFNLRTIRYSEEEIQKIASSDNFLTLSFTLNDKFGDYGLICIVILKEQSDTLFIDTWIMSCRVLERTMENFVLNRIVELGKQNCFIKLIGEYIPTAKNGLVKDLYKNLGFVNVNNKWILNLNDYKEGITFIKDRR